MKEGSFEQLKTLIGLYDCRYLMLQKLGIGWSIDSAYRVSIGGEKPLIWK